jgi:hypothetical protein
MRVFLRNRVGSGDRENAGAVSKLLRDLRRAASDTVADERGTYTLVSQGGVTTTGTLGPTLVLAPGWILNTLDHGLLDFEGGIGLFAAEKWAPWQDGRASVTTQLGWYLSGAVIFGQRLYFLLEWRDNLHSNISTPYKLTNQAQQDRTNMGFTVGLRFF